MKNLPSLPLLLSVIFLQNITAQTCIEDFLLTANYRAEYLLYHYLKDEDLQLKTGHDPVAILTLPVIIRFDFDKKNGKKYVITEDGGFLYYYSDPDVKSKSGLKPITERTFYLEASRNGIISSEISYGEFTGLSVSEKRNLLDSENNTPSPGFERNKQESTEANLRYMAFPDGLRLFLRCNDWQIELIKKDELVTNRPNNIWIRPLSNETPIPEVVTALVSKNKNEQSGNNELKQWNNIMKEAGKKTAPP